MRTGSPTGWLCRLFTAAAVLDFVAMLAFLVVYVTRRALVTDWVARSPMFAGAARNDGVAATALHAAVGICAVHLVVTAVFVWLAVVIGHGGRRVRAAVLLVVTTAIDGFVITTPVSGLVQQVVMAVAIAVKLAALGLLVVLWRQRRPSRDSTGSDWSSSASASP